MLIAVYGSLRPGQFNHEYYSELYGAESMVFVTRGRLPGYDLYSLGPFPAAVSRSGARGIVVDILRVSPQVAVAIDSMERAAGYDRRLAQMTPGRRLMFWTRAMANHNWTLVDDGDWVRYITEQDKLKKEIHKGHDYYKY